MLYYRTQLHPWCIIRLLPNAQRITVARFRKRNDADAHARTLKRLIPQALLVVIFEPPKVPVSETINGKCCSSDLSAREGPPAPKFDTAGDIHAL